MNRDVFLSLLALDSYNRGYGQNVGGLSNTGSLGAATIIDTPLPTGSVAAGFYAIAYAWNGQKIISYRWTDNPSLLSTESDNWNGWTVGAGFAGASQAGNDNARIERRRAA